MVIADTPNAYAGAKRALKGLLPYKRGIYSYKGILVLTVSGMEYSEFHFYFDKVVSLCQKKKSISKAS